MRTIAAVLGVAWLGATIGYQSKVVEAQPAATVWQVDNLSRIGGHPVTVLGKPTVVQTDVGAAVAFNGTTDGLLLDDNPLAGLSRFTLEVLFAPDSDGSEEQRFLHLEEASTGNRALIELRQQPGGRWSLDTYLRSGDAERTLLDRSLSHEPVWHVATLTFDGEVMAAYVDGVPQGGGPVAFRALRAGRTSIGVRQNQRSWFKGRIRTIRITPGVLPPREFLAPPPRSMFLWPEGVPGLKPDASAERVVDGRVTNVHNPTLVHYPPTPGTANGTAMILCAGGAYARLALSNEIAGLTPLLTAQGVSVFVLEYRLAEYGQPAPLRDVLRAIRLVRSRAAALGVRPDRVGLFGASAGGHLAASAATMFDSPEGRTGADLDRVSGRPDFVALLYPVVTMKPPFAHGESRRNLLGDSPTAALVDRYSIEGQVGPRVPPVFLVHTSADRSVPIENSMLLASALRAAGVPVETHFYERGPHGFGVSAGLGPASQWPTSLVEWMEAHGWIARAVEADSGPPGAQQVPRAGAAWPALIVAGDHPDPSVLKDGDNYYMTHSSFDAYPGLLIWHSRDLVNWRPVGPALRTNVGSVWAPDLIKHNGRFYIYFPGVGPYRSNYVVWADDIGGPWSEPVDLKVDRIDPGHAVGEDGRRYLFMSGGYRVPLAEDGLSVTGPAEKVYDGWRYPADWVVESFSQEGPKIMRRGDYFYMVLAEGGTAGPPTGHMVVAARARSIDGPWEDSPYNPIVRTREAAERWWSKGHGTLVEGPAAQWFLVYHAYENGFYTLGRQTLIEPVTWTDEGWFRTGLPGAVSLPEAGPEFRVDLSDDFSTNRMGRQWSFYKGTAGATPRYRYENGSLVLRALGRAAADSSPLAMVTGDHGYEFEVEIEADPGATAGALLFYSSRLYAGLGYSAGSFILHRYGTDRVMAKPRDVGSTLHLRVRNDRHIVTIAYSTDGTAWQRFGTSMEVSGYHHNVAGEFLSLRPAIYAAGTGEVRFRNFRYRVLP
jgi:beta-xylosidase/acetyl esterase/lipase